MKRKITSLILLTLVILALPMFTLQAKAADDTHINSVDVFVELNEDGSANIRETWDIIAAENISEWYLQRINLDRQNISALKVSENGKTFKDMGEWNVDASRKEKTMKSGIVTLSNGYELCWGIGASDRHVFEIEYKMTNFVKRCTDGAYINQTLVTPLDNTVDKITCTLSKPGLDFTKENTGVWGAGFEGLIYVENGKVLTYTNNEEADFHTFDVLIQFAEGMFSPAVTTSKTFEEIKQSAMEGMDYPDTDLDALLDEDGHVLVSKPKSLFSFAPFFAVGGIALFFIIAAFSSDKDRELKKMKPEYKNVTYSRSLPFQNSLAATYTRLKDLSQHESDSNIIGAFMLRWIRTGLIQLGQESTGILQNKETSTLKLGTPSKNMEFNEKQLYGMLLAAAGLDRVLQTKEFEKWSRKNYEKVQGWFSQYHNLGRDTMRELGALGESKKKTFFGKRKQEMTEYGEKLSIEMFGFKKYLSDFTIINERQAREVQLWDDYLVYAQVFGIAQEVAKQFETLYPDYFKQADPQTSSHLTFYDIMLINRLSYSYGHAMTKGMRSGFSSSSMGGGGGSTFSGGGFSGSSGGGGSSGGR